MDEIQKVLESIKNTFHIEYHIFDKDLNFVVETSFFIKDISFYTDISLFSILMKECFKNRNSNIIIDSSNVVAIGIYVEKYDIYVLLSHFFIETYSNEYIKKSLFKTYKSLEVVYQTVPKMLQWQVLNASEIINIFNFLNQYCNNTNKIKSLEEVVIYKRDKTLSRVPRYQTISNAYDKYIEYLDPDVSQKFENTKMIISKIKSGDFDSVDMKMFLHKDIFNDNDYEYFIGLMTLICMCAFDAGVDLDLITAMYNYYIHLYKKNKNGIYANMIMDFVSKIKRIKMIENCSLHVQKTISYVEAHIKEKLDSDSLAKIAGISKNYLLEIFKKEVGISLVDYINFWKIELAKEYLLKTEMSIVEISNNLSFNNQSYFSSVFKKFTHETPLSYRNKMKILNKKDK